jgi:predicted signal transduction protein with EAL and GGDEF domain
MGGDEFVLILDDCSSAGELERAAYNLLGTISEPIEVGDVRICVNASIGISEYPRDGDSEKVLLQNSDAALLGAKAGGRNTYRFYRQEYSRDLNRRIEIDSGLRKAMDEERLECYFQPQIDVRTGEIIAFESLARWNHPDRGLIEAREFIDEAETSGVLNEVNMKLVEQAASQVRQWWRLCNSKFRLVVNVSATEIAPGYADRIVSTLARSDFPARYLELEITERVLMADDPVRKSELEALHAVGVILTMDNFGVDHSFFRDLCELPFTRLKIGSSLVATMEDKSAQTILRALMVLGEGFGIEVVAEGVETGVQCRQLRNLGCFIQQGYYHAPPLAAGEGVRFLEESRQGTRRGFG